MSFESFFLQLSSTNSTLESLVDFEKVIKHISKIEAKLNQLNYLLGKSNLLQAVKDLYEENEKCFAVLTILVAVRGKKPILSKNGEIYDINDFLTTPEKIYRFIRDTGLINVFRDKQITNLVDYAFGIEVGLDTNTRKNRGGKNMESAVATVFDLNGIDYKREVKHTFFEKLADFGDDVKRFDFVIETPLNTYLIETNYYNSGGSKLNEVARAYTDIAPKINKHERFEFVWITDGQGWHSAKNKLQEAFNKIPKIYNLKTINEFIDILKSEFYDKTW